MSDHIQPPSSREDRLRRVVTRGKKLQLQRALRWVGAAAATLAVVGAVSGVAFLNRPEMIETAGPVTTQPSATPSPTTPLTPEQTDPRPETDQPGEIPAEPVDRTDIVAEGIVPLAKAEGWRNELWGEDAPVHLLEIAYDLGTAQRAWSENVPADLGPAEGMPEHPAIYGSLDEVDFESHLVVVWSSGQSGSCPGWLADVNTTDGRVEVETRIAAQVRGDREVACTGDYNTYRMVLAVPRDRLPNPEDLPFEEPGPGHDWTPSLRVVEYPS